MVLIRGAVAFLILLLLVEPQGVRAQTAPKLVSVFPLGGQRGTVLEVEVRGTVLEGTYAVWLGPGSQLESLKPPSASQHTKGPDGVEAQVQAVPDGSRAKLRLVIAVDARVGFHTLALISPGGLSGSIPFWVGPDPVIQETTTPHRTPQAAQPVKVPVAINGRISESGQLAYYTFEIDREQTVAFEVVSLHGTGFDPQLALYEAGGSYLDPGRSKRLLFQEEVTHGGMPASRRITYRFTKPGSYLISLSTIFAQGGGDFSYLLRTAADDRPAGEDALAWARRRLGEIRSRAIGAPAAEVALVKEGQANAFAIPAVLEGVIGRAGDTDHFRFRAKAGQKVALEIQTPRAGPPHFNLRLDVLDDKGTVVLTNLRAGDAKIGTVDTKVIQVSPEALGKLDADGEYTLRLRDLTSVHGSSEHAYRVLVRPQVPHVGDIKIQPEGAVNLLPGGRQRLTVSAPGKEEYAGTLALSVEGLPQGVRAFVGANGSTVELVADTSAPASLMPQMLRIGGLPVAGEKAGSAFPMAEIPVMVVKK